MSVYIVIKDGLPVGVYDNYLLAVKVCDDASYMVYEMTPNKNYDTTIDIAGNIVNHFYQ